MILGVLFKLESVTFRIHFETNRPVLSLFVHVPRLITPGRLYPFPNTLYQELKIIIICNYLMILFCQNFLEETDGNRWNFRLGCNLTDTRNQLSLCERAGFWICLTSEGHLMSLNRWRNLSETRKTCLLLLYFEEGERGCQARCICILWNPIFLLYSFFFTQQSYT